MGLSGVAIWEKNRESRLNSVGGNTNDEASKLREKWKLYGILKVNWGNEKTSIMSNHSEISRGMINFSD